MLPKKGRKLPDRESLGPYASAVAQALKCRLGNNHQGVKTVMRWTGAAERTVKYWFAGVNGPGGRHLVELLRHSDEVLEVVLVLAGREQTIAAKKLVDAKEKVAEALAMIQSLTDHQA